MLIILGACVAMVCALTLAARGGLEYERKAIVPCALSWLGSAASYGVAALALSTPIS